MSFSFAVTFVKVFDIRKTPQFKVGFNFGKSHKSFGAECGK